jgi:hypothetical protein
MVQSQSQVKSSQDTIVRKMPHTAHKGGSLEFSHVQSLLSSLAGPEEKNDTAAFLRGSGLKQHL